ncbi:MAG: polysaccharide biosynthesis C-terminal domain-containing protein [Bacteroidetes bacterium]|nr:polysaccharide biosynthesis C-terminal domain-containing protein [Bacteroidota bacterium]
MEIIVKLRNKYHSLFKSTFIINIIIVGLITVFVKGFGFFKEMKVGQTYGLSELLDTFLVASLIPGFVNNVFMVSFQNLFIPNYVAEQRQNKNVVGFQSACFLITLCLGIFLMLISYLITDLFLENFYVGHSLDYYQLIRIQFYIILPCVLFWSFSSLLAGLLEIKGLFYYTSFYTIITSIVTIVLLFIFKNELGTKLLSIGLLLGSILEFLYLLILSFLYKTIHLGKPDFKSTNVKILFKQFPSKIGAGFLSGSTGFINQFFAAQLLVGSLASFNYGLKIPSFLVSILAIAIGNVVLPFFSHMVYDNRKKAFQVLFRLIFYVFIGSIIVVGLSFVFSESIIRLLFERKNFTYKDTVVVSNIQRILLLYVPFYISGVILNKFLTSINKNEFMFYTSVLNLFLNLIMNYYLAKFYGIYGLAVATTSVSVINFIVLYIVVYIQNKKIIKNQVHKP